MAGFRIRENFGNSVQTYSPDWAVFYFFSYLFLAQNTSKMAAGYLNQVLNKNRFYILDLLRILPKHKGGTYTSSKLLLVVEMTGFF